MWGQEVNVIMKYLRWLQHTRSLNYAFLAVAFLVQLIVCVLGAVQGFLAVSSDDHSRVYLVIRLLAVLAYC